MARKHVSRYVCSNCGALADSWSGRCAVCGEWNTMTEQLEVTAARSSLSQTAILKAESIDSAIKHDLKRLSTLDPEINAVLGGGLVAGAITLIAGEPGIGKSTMLLQIAAAVAQSAAVLYVSGEESVYQVGLRAQRLGARHPKLAIASSTSADEIAATIATGTYKLVIVDSIQMVAVSELSSAAGTVSQITASTQIITMGAKQTNTAVILVGHVTKEGSIAGPKVLEHIVDVVLQIEGDRYGGFKVIRAVKNRFGPTTEVGIFEMRDDGMKPVNNPSAALLAERQISDGSVVLATVEGSRPLLVEVQALVNPTSYGYAKRTVSGFDLNRLNLLTAVLERRTKLSLAEKDIYINIVGGIQIREPAADLAVCMAIASAAKQLQLKQNAVVFGEVGLSGEIRHVPFVERRIGEAKKLGFNGGIGPRQSGSTAISHLFPVTDLRSALNQFLEKE